MTTKTKKNSSKATETPNKPEAAKKKPVTAMTPEERLGKAAKLRSRKAKLEPRLDPKNNASEAEVEQAKQYLAKIDEELKELENFDKPETEKKPEPEKKPEVDNSKKAKYENFTEAAAAFREGKMTEAEFEEELVLQKGKKKTRTATGRTRTPGEDCDKYGSRPGTMSFKMNAALFNENGELRRIKTIAALSGATETRVRGHIRWLKAKGHKIG